MNLLHSLKVLVFPTKHLLIPMVKMCRELKISVKNPLKNYAKPLVKRIEYTYFRSPGKHTLIK